MEVFMSSISGVSSTSYDSSFFTKMDTDGDGKVSKSEFEAMAAKRKTENSDSTTDSTSNTGQADDMFSKIDTDGDGSISQEEDEAWQAQMQKNGPPPPPPTMYNANGQTTTSASQTVDAIA
jgi:Ca2+-binding EF-hand superfamily protein